MTKALIIGTSTAVSNSTSGASLRLLTIKYILKESGYETVITPRRDAAKYLTEKWGLIVVVSYSNVFTLIRAKRNKSHLWFDATDSWRVTRKSLAHAGDVRQIPLMVRDLFFELFLPQLTLVSFISDRDLQAEKKHLRKKTTSFFIVPNLLLQREVRNSQKSRFVFVGDGNYLPNRKAIEFLLNLYSIYPEIAPTHIYGRGYEDISNEKLVIHGYDDSEVYFTKDIHLAPIFFGAGVKNKVAIPASNGLQVVTTNEGAVGLRSLPNVHLAENYTSFATQMKNALSIVDSGYPTSAISDPFINSEIGQIKKLLSMISQSNKSEEK